MDTDRRRESISILQLSTTVAVVLLVLLMITVDHSLKIGGFRILPTLVGITGLAFTAIGLYTMDSFRRDWATSRTGADGADPISSSDFLPLLFEIGLWAIGVLYVIRLVEIANG